MSAKMESLLSKKIKQTIFRHFNMIYQIFYDDFFLFAHQYLNAVRGLQNLKNLHF